MIHIALEQLQEKISPEWHEKARQVKESLLAGDRSSADPEERKKARKEVIEDNQAIWKGLKTPMSKVSNGKCWYCETWEIRSDTAVDHYRPKNAVKECPDHPGYWWLAFDWENYRYSCQYCNEKRVDQDTGITGGKGTCFPLVRPENRVYEPGELLYEEPVLLDPTIESDVLALSFEEDGTAQPRWQEENYPVLYMRALESITLYNLNKQELKERRQTAICVEIRKLIAQGDKYFARLQNSDPSARDAFNETIQRLGNMISLAAEYSAAAKSVIAFYRDHPWVDAFVCTRMM